MTGRRVRHLAHLVTRFIGSLRPGAPAPDDERWARGLLTKGEQNLWLVMSNPDRRHAVGVARAVEAELGPGADRAVLAAALLHDSGKIVSGLRTPARALATLVWLLVDDERAATWQHDSSVIKRRLGQYWLHPELGAEQLRAVGSDPLAVAWAREHHLPPEQWSVPRSIATVLKSCDDD